MADISNSDDVIDSRDVIARIEELEEQCTPWIAGFNMPGYMPDSEPAAFANWVDAQAYIAAELKRYADETEENEETLRVDIDAAAERLDALDEGSEYGEAVGKWHFWITNAGAQNGLDEAEQHDLASLRKLAAEASDYADDWEYGETLIRDSYFVDHARELVEDCYDLKIPDFVEVDWSATARNIRVDYTAVDYDGVTYWIR